MLALACARCSVIIGSYGSYRFSDDGINTDGSAFLMIALYLVVLVVMVVRKTQLKKRTVNVMMNVAIVTQIVTLVSMPFIEEAVPSSFFTLCIHSLNEIFGMFMIAYWLRYMRDANMVITVGIVTIGMIFSEIILFTVAYIPSPFNEFIAAILTALQVVLFRLAFKSERPYRAKQHSQVDLLTDFVRDNNASKRFLIALALGIGFMSIVIGFLRGYPDGQPIEFEPATRFAYFFLVVALCVISIVATLRGERRVVSIYSWIVMQILACASMLLYAMFPDSLDIGAVASVSLNAIMVMFTFFGIVAFMSYGWRDPFFYAIGGFTVFLLPRSLARMSELFLLSHIGFTPVMLVALIMGCIVLSSQVVFVQLLKMNDADDAKTAQKNNSRFIERFMGLDNEAAPETMDEVRLRSMHMDVEKMGKQFLLSDREVEVVALYAMGYTQQKVADELSISAGTVHAHIKRIYAKTGMHSRQDIIDYLKQNS